MVMNSLINRRHIMKTMAAAGGATLLTPPIMASAAMAGKRADHRLKEAPISNSITDWDAVTLSARIKSKAVSCVDVMTAYLDRIEKINPEVNAIVALQDRNNLVLQAKSRDQELAQGQYRGWMHGFPHAAKDLANTKGITTTVGSPIFKENVPDFDQLIIERIKAAGAIIIGKTNVPEFGLGCQTYNNVYGTTGNAYDHSKTSGGSSGGACVSLALNMLPVADGSDMAGSLRNPASFNNVVGFRPSFGSVPSYPSGDIWFASMGTAGPLGRNVRDVAMLHSVMAGYDSRVPLSLKQDTGAFRNIINADVKGRKIGWLSDLGGYLPIEDGILELCEYGLKTFADIGCHVEATKPDVDPAIGWDAWLVLRNLQVGGLLKPLYDDPAKRALIKPEAIWETENYIKRSAEDVNIASQKRSSWYESFNRLFEKYDFLVLPGAQVFPFDKKIHWLKEVNGVAMNTYHQWMTVYCLVTLTGCPVINVPVGFNDKGLPMGMQIIGKNQSDLAVLKMGHAFEAAHKL